MWGALFGVRGVCVRAGFVGEIRGLRVFALERIDELAMFSSAANSMIERLTVDTG